MPTERTGHQPELEDATIGMAAEMLEADDSFLSAIVMNDLRDDLGAGRLSEVEFQAVMRLLTADDVTTEPAPTDR